MKKAIIATIITITIIIACSFVMTASAELYPETARVVILNEAEDLVTVETFNGHLFIFEGCEDYMVGDGVSLIMEDNGTEKVFDDKIVMAQYCGWDLINWYTGE